MEFVPHADRLRHQRGQIDPFLQRRQHRFQHRGQRVAHPAQALLHVLAVGAEAHHFADAFVHVAVGVIAVNGVPDHHHRHVGRGDAAHRPHRAHAVARDKLDFPLRQQRQRLLLILRPAFEQAGADAGAAYRAAHLLPGDRRAGMQQLAPFGQLRDQPVRQIHILPVRARLADTGDNGGVCLLNRCVHSGSLL